MSSNGDDGREWVVLFEATAARVSLSSVECLLGHLGALQPSALFDPGRSAVQLRVRAPAPDTALAVAFSSWRDAVAAAGLGDWTVERVEITSVEELADDWRRYRETTERITTHEAVEAAYHATRRLLWIKDARDAAAVVSDLVHQLGGSTVPAQQGHPSALAMDLSFGAMEPVQPAAPPGSTARRHLEETIRPVADDAWRVLRLRTHDGHGGPGHRMSVSDN